MASRFTSRMVFLAIVFAAITSSCRKVANTPSATQLVLNATASAGATYTEGITHIRSLLLSPASPALQGPSRNVSSRELFQHAADYMTAQLAYSTLTATPTPELLRKINNLRANPSPEAMQAEWALSLSIFDNNRLITSREKRIVQEIYQAFDFLYQKHLSAIQYHDTLNQQLTAIQAKYANAVYSDNEGELCNGLLAIALSSNEYHFHNNYRTGAFTASPFILTPAQQCMVQLDCIGYIAGWSNALWEDQHTATGILPVDQWNRVGQGILWSIAAGSATLLP